MKKDSLGIQNSITYESLVTWKLLRKAVHELKGLSSFPLHELIQRGFEQTQKARMNAAKWWAKVKMSTHISVHKSMSVF